jgi:hypothetical protein
LRLLRGARRLGGRGDDERSRCGAEEDGNSGAAK